jgi:hypothetical protein
LTAASSAKVSSSPPSALSMSMLLLGWPVYAAVARAQVSQSRQPDSCSRAAVTVTTSVTSHRNRHQ